MVKEWIFVEWVERGVVSIESKEIRMGDRMVIREWVEVVGCGVWRKVRNIWFVWGR